MTTRVSAKQCADCGELRVGKHHCSAKRPAPPCRYCGAPCRYIKAFSVGSLWMRGGWAMICHDPACQKKFDADSEQVYAEMERAEDARQLQALYDAAEFPPELFKHELQDFNLDFDRSLGSFYIWGPNGTGKSALAVALMKSWQKPCHWISAHRYLIRVKSTYRRRGGQSEEDVMNELMRWPVLCIDDLGAEPKSDFNVASIYELVKERHEHGKHTIITSNLSITDIDSQIDPRLASRLATHRIVKITGKDRRVA